jgi:hypothetical protein
MEKAERKRNRASIVKVEAIIVIVGSEMMKNPVYIKDDKIEMNLKEMKDSLGYPVDYHDRKYVIVKKGTTVDIYRDLCGDCKNEPEKGLCKVCSGNFRYDKKTCKTVCSEFEEKVK